MQKIYSTLTAVVAIFIVYTIYAANTGNTLPAANYLRSIAYGDKVAHFMLFGFLSFLFNLALATKCFEFGRFSVYRGSMLVGVAALLEELSQQFILTRTFEYYDLLADFSGIACFALITALLTKRRMNSHSSWSK